SVRRIPAGPNPRSMVGAERTAALLWKPVRSGGDHTAVPSRSSVVHVAPNPIGGRSRCRKIGPRRSGHRVPVGAIQRQIGSSPKPRARTHDRASTSRAVAMRKGDPDTGGHATGRSGRGGYRAARRAGSAPDRVRAREANGVTDLDGRVVVITGGNGGIGLGMAHGVAAAGAAVAVWGRDEAKNDAAVEALRAAGAVASSVVVDVADEAAVDAAI